MVGYTIHYVLAGAYAGKDISSRPLLKHASLDGGETALCGRVKRGNLCDLRETEVTCQACLKKIASQKLSRQDLDTTKN